VRRSRPVELAELRGLVERGDASDRAFVDAMIRIAWSRTGDPERLAELGQLHGELQAAALRAHANLRAEIGGGALRGAELRVIFDEAPLLARDHFVEEVLGIAYPPLDEPELPPELLAYMPSGYDEIVYAFDVTGLAAGDRFLDIGSGTGKAVMLAELLVGASGSGIERDAELHALAEHASRELGLECRFDRGDVRERSIEPVDVVFMYLPFTGSVLAGVMRRLIERPPRFVCAGAFDAKRYRELVAAGPPRSWLHVYAWRPR